MLAVLEEEKKTINSIWGNQSSILVGDYLLSRCFEMMVEDGNLVSIKIIIVNVFKNCSR